MKILLRLLLLTVLRNNENVKVGTIVVDAFLPKTTTSNRQCNIFDNQRVLCGPNNDDDNEASKNSYKPTLITFDLDDTLFPIGPVVKEANDVLIQELSTTYSSDITESSLVETTRSIRKELKVKNEVIPYTELRKRAIRIEIEKYTSTEPTSDRIDELYRLWEIERHAAAERHLFDETIPMLQELRQEGENDDDFIIGAITNGKGNPFQMPSLCSYFDFCISGEDADVFPSRKPNPGIYNAALERYKSILLLQQQLEDEDDENENNEEEEDKICWIHIGDDLANDVGASYNCGAMPIWVNFLNDQEEEEQQSWSTATQEELEKRAQMNQESKACISATVHTLMDLPKTVDSLIEKEKHTRGKMR